MFLLHTTVLTVKSFKNFKFENTTLSSWIFKTKVANGLEIKHNVFFCEHFCDFFVFFSENNGFVTSRVYPFLCIFWTGSYHVRDLKENILDVLKILLP